MQTVSRRTDTSSCRPAAALSSSVYLRDTEIWSHSSSTRTNRRQKAQTLKLKCPFTHRCKTTCEHPAVSQQISLRCRITVVISDQRFLQVSLTAVTFHLTRLKVAVCSVFGAQEALWTRWISLRRMKAHQDDWRVLGDTLTSCGGGGLAVSRVPELRVTVKTSETLRTSSSRQTRLHLQSPSHVSCVFIVQCLK